MRTKYYIYKEILGDETHEHDLVEHSSYEVLEEAQKELAKIIDVYARIEKHWEEYTPPPAGRQYKEERFGWSTEKTEVVEEN